MLGRHIGNILGNDHYLEVRYEDLVINPREELSRVCRFIGEAYEEAMLDYYRDSERWIPADSRKYHRTSMQAPDPMKVQSWRKGLDSADRIIFDQTAGTVLDEFGYERNKETACFSSGLRNAYYALVRRW
jgi:hypothetical protein